MRSTRFLRGVRSQLVLASGSAVAFAGLLTAFVLVAGAAAHSAASEPPPTAPATTTSATSTSGLVLPNPELTPGAYNRAVRQTTIRRTICVAGWTRRIRPPVGYTNALKRTQMAEYGETGPPSAYEEDHFIPLELGGAPRDPRNLWPEPRPQAQKSDPLETRLRRRVCRGAMTVAAIRRFKDAHG